MKKKSLSQLTRLFCFWKIKLTIPKHGTISSLKND